MVKLPTLKCPFCENVLEQSEASRAYCNMCHIEFRICSRCDYIFVPRVPHPVTCAKCRSPYWNKPRVYKQKGGEDDNKTLC